MNVLWTSKNLSLYLCLTSVCSKIMEQIVLCAITLHIEDNQRIRPSQQGFGKGNLICLTNLTSSYDKVTCLVGHFVVRGEVGDVSNWTSAKPLTLHCVPQHSLAEAGSP